MSEWVQTTLGDLFDVDNVKLGVHTDEPTVMSLSKYDGFVRADEYFDKRIASASLDGYKIVEPGEWAFSTIHIDEGSIARNNLGERGVISPMYTTMRFRSETCLPEYAELLLREPTMLVEYSRRAQGSINRRRSLPFKSFAAIEVALPPLAEQRRIVDVMAAVDVQIEALAEEIAQSIAAGLALTGGFSTTSRPLGSAVRARGGKRLPKGEALLDSPTAHPYLRVTDMVDLGFRQRDVRFVPDNVWPSIKRYVVRAGEVVISIVGTIGRLAVVPDWADGANLTENAAIVDILDRDRIDPHWLAMWLTSADGQQEIERVTVGTSQPKLALSRIPLIEVPEIALDEQRRVASASLAVLQGVEQVSAELAALRSFRSTLLTSLLNQEIEIPESYEALLEAVS